MCVCVFVCQRLLRRTLACAREHAKARESAHACICGFMCMCTRACICVCGSWYLEVGQASLLGLDGPLGAVAVAAEDDTFVLFEHVGHRVAQGDAGLERVVRHTHTLVCVCMCVCHGSAG